MSEITKLAPALVAAQSQMPVVGKDAKNPHLKNDYTTLDAIIKAVRPVLAEHRLSFVQTFSADGETNYLDTILIHESGQSLSSRITVNAMASNRGTNEMQALGSTLTYLKRYALAAMLGIATGEDDDGNGAGDQKKQPATPSTPKATAPKSADDLMALVNEKLGTDYVSPVHVKNAIKKHTGIDDYDWPPRDDVNGWKFAYKQLADYNESKKQ